MTVTGDGQWLRPPSGVTPPTGTFSGAHICRNTGSQSITIGNVRQITFPTTIYDTDGYVSGNTLVIPTGFGGRFVCYASVLMGQPFVTGEDLWVMLVCKNGTSYGTAIKVKQYTPENNPTAYGADVTMETTFPVVLADGDIISVGVDPFQTTTVFTNSGDADVMLALIKQS